MDGAAVVQGGVGVLVLGVQIEVGNDQIEGHGDAFADVAFGADGPVHRLNDPAAQGRAEAGPAGAAPFLGGGLEDVGELIGRQARPGVADTAFQGDPGRGDPGLQAGFHRALAGGFDRHPDEI